MKFVVFLAVGALIGIAYGRRGLKSQPREARPVRNNPMTILVLFVGGAAIAIWLAQYLI